jgi:hypothetical protein
MLGYPLTAIAILLCGFVHRKRHATVAPWLHRKTRHRNRWGFQLNEAHFLVALTLAHLARFAALIRARPAAEMRRLGAIETIFRPRARAQRAF